MQCFGSVYFLVISLAVDLCVRGEVRDSTLLDTGWRYQQGDPADAQQPVFNDANWPVVFIPHCWGWEQAQRGRMYYRGPGWYRRGLDLGVPQPGKRYFLRFEAASSVADVSLNGQFLGEHRGGFGAFSFEITTNLSASGTNMIAVRVSNAPAPDIAPLSGDFPFYGGIYRPVHLIVTGAENFTLTDHASPGVEWLQSHITSREAVLDVKTEISNGTNKKQPLTLIARLLDADGKEAAVARQDIVLEPVVAEPFNLQIKLAGPHLWNGRKDPYLYHAVVELRSGGRLVDSVAQMIGLRYYTIDPDKGFFLNGRPYSLHGVDRHQDRPDKGWEISEADQDEDMALLKEIGATVIRCAHYQHSDYFYSLCDQAGILVWAEIPQVDRITAGPKFEETSRNQLLDLIRQNINHPSIFVWSLFNELRPGNPDPHRELEDLNILAHGEDPTRPTIAATCTDGWPQMSKIPDLLGWNIYPGWYPGWGTKDDFGKLLDRYRYTSQSGGFCVSEYGAGANAAQHEDNPRQPVADSQWHPEEWQAIVHESAWQAIKVRPFVWASFAWNMFDFTSYWRHEGGVLGRNDKGLVSYDRRTKKDAFYFYKPNSSDEPVLYITDRRFIERTNSVTDVKIYSNARKVALFLNGVSQGEQTNDDNSVFVWKNVQLQSGENVVEARAERNSQTLKDQCVWKLATARFPLPAPSSSAGQTHLF